MKILTLVFVLLLSSVALAKDKFWVSNKLEVGYGKIFISDQIRLDNNESIRNSLAIGTRFKVSDAAAFKTFYLLEKASKDDWKNNHFLGAKFELKLR